MGKQRSAISDQPEGYGRDKTKPMVVWAISSSRGDARGRRRNKANGGLGNLVDVGSTSAGPAVAPPGSKTAAAALHTVPWDGHARSNTGRARVRSPSAPLDRKLHGTMTRDDKGVLPGIDPR